MKYDIPKISLKEKIGYGLGDTASNLFFQITIYWIAMFYTDVFGMDPKHLALMFLLTRIWDAINDPIMGAFADKTNSRWGKFRPYLLWFSVPFGIIFAMMFITPDFTYNGKLAYAYITYTLMMMIYTAINVPYAALMGVITPSSAQRTVISTFRFVLVFIAQFIVQYALPFMVVKFGGGNDILGWQRSIFVLAAGATMLFLVTFGTTNERVPVTKSQKNSFGTNIKDLLRNYPWLLIGGATIFQLTFVVMRGSNIAYYFKYFIKEQPVGIFGIVYNLSSTQLVANYMLMGTFFTIIGAIFTRSFSNRFGKSNTYSVFMFLAAISCGLVYFLKPEQIILLFLLQFVTSFALGPVSVLQWAIYTDTADYQEWKNNRRSTAFIMAASLFALKLGVAFGGAILAWILHFYGYVKNVDNQSVEALNGLHLAMSIFPAMTAIAAMAFMIPYPLNKERMEQIETDLIQRHTNSGI